MGIVAVLAGPAPLSAHVGFRVLPVYEVPGFGQPDVTDGGIEDWEELVPEASITYLDVAPAAGDVEPGYLADTADLSFRVFLGWSPQEQRLYLGVERVDDVYVNTYDGTGVSAVWGSDAVEWAVDGDHSGGPYYLSLNDERLYHSQAQHYVLLAPDTEPQCLFSYVEPKGFATRPPWSEAGGVTVGQVPSYSVIEAAITPWDELSEAGPQASTRSELFPGKVIGMQLGFSDFDWDEGLHAFYTIDGKRDFWQDATEFADAMLLCAGGTCGEGPASAVRPDSWGRIKAGLHSP